MTDRDTDDFEDVVAEVIANVIVAFVRMPWWAVLLIIVMGAALWHLFI